MRPLHLGFTDELVKLSSSAEFTRDEIKDLFQEVKAKTQAQRDPSFFKQTGKHISKGVDLATPAAMGGIASPTLAILGIALKRKLHNREIKQLLKAPEIPKKMRKQLASQLHKGPLIAKSNIGKGRYTSAITTPKDLAVDATKGMAVGTGYQIVRSRRNKDKD